MGLIYAVDSYAEFAGEIGAVVSFVRGVGECVVVIWGEEWLEMMGKKKVVGIMAGVQVFVALFGVVFLVCGKKVRVWTGRWGVLRWVRKARIGVAY